MSLEETIATILREYGDEVEQLLADSARRKRLELTKELISSIKTQVIVRGANEAGMLLSFQDYGRYNDMKALTFDRHPPVDVIAEWVEKKGIEKFKKIPGYLNSRPQDPKKAAIRIAWAIAKNRTSGNYKKRNRAWFAKTFYSTLNGLIDKLLETLTEEQIQQLQNAAK